MMHEGLLTRANRRAQRRLRALIIARTYSDMDSRESRLYTQAERLVDTLQVESEWEREKAEFDLLLAQDHDFHVINGVTVASCDDCTDDVRYIFAIAAETESELRFAHGDR